jgi:hypothetical protein
MASESLLSSASYLGMLGQTLRISLPFLLGILFLSWANVGIVSKMIRQITFISSSEIYWLGTGIISEHIPWFLKGICCSVQCHLTSGVLTTIMNWVKKVSQEHELLRSPADFSILTYNLVRSSLLFLSGHILSNARLHSWWTWTKRYGLFPCWEQEAHLPLSFNWGCNPDWLWQLGQWVHLWYLSKSQTFQTE